ncbi:MAG TPA: hypothetical protein VFX30_14580 [bacterium]|nr:hypothetical protein [bacterium]
MINRFSLLAVVTLASAAALWGAGCGSPSRTSVNASIAVPFELLTIDSYQVELILFDAAETTTLRGPVALTHNADNELWTGDLEDVDDQEFVAVVDVVAPLADGTDVLLARASRKITVPKGAPFATLTFKPLDFDTNLDDDGDTLTNATEYANDLNPEAADSDGDGVSDAEELGGTE